jgi:hypothetical protein
MKAEEFINQKDKETEYTWIILTSDVAKALEEYASIKLAEYKAELTEKVKCMDGIRFDIGKNKYETHLIKSEILKAIKP